MEINKVHFTEKQIQKLKRMYDNLPECMKHQNIKSLPPNIFPIIKDLK